MTLTPAQITFLNRVCGKGKWSINADTGFIDVNGTVNLPHKDHVGNIDVKFGFITGSFNMGWCEYGSLVFSPNRISEDFICSGNTLTSLVNGPQYVGRTYECDGNDLISLVGAPQYVGGDFKCWNNKLTTLDYLPEHIGGSIDCFDEFLYHRNNPFIVTPELIHVIQTRNIDDKQALLQYLRDNLHKHYGLSKDNPLVGKIWKELLGT